MQPVVRTSMLTPRQEEIVALVAEGLTNGEIAERLGLTPGTVSNHISNIRWCLGLRHRSEIVAWAFRAGVKGLALNLHMLTVPWGQMNLPTG